MIDYNKIINLINDGFLKNKGKGTIFAYSPLNIGNMLYDILYKLTNKRPDEKVLIIIGDYKYKIDIINSIRNHYSLEIATFIENHIQFLSQSYAYNKLYCYTVNILIDINSVDFIKKSSIESKFTLCIITNNSLKINILNNIQLILPIINIGVGDNQLQQEKINTPINEYRHPIYLTEEEQSKYEKYSSFIKDSMTVFGTFENVEYCRNGYKYANISAIEFCTTLAKQNGWDYELDMSVEFNVQIDKIYNPNAIHERAQLIYNITRERKNFVCNINSKIDEIINIIKANPFRKIVIVSKSGEFANEIADKINKFNTDSNNNFLCGLYHNEIPASYMPDEHGNYITYKSGIDKGKPKLFKSASLSTYYEKLYNLNHINILSIKASSDIKLNINIDIIIFTTTLIDNIFQFKARFRNCNYINKVTEIHRLYCKDTIEENVLYKENPTNLITLCNSDTTKDVSINEQTGEINL